MSIDYESVQFLRSLRTAVFWPVAFIFLTAVCLLILIGWLFHTTHWADHSYQVLAQAHECENRIIISQDAVRGYLLTGDSVLLEPYTGAFLQSETELDTLRSMVKDNPPQVDRIDDIIHANNAWLENSRLLISRRQKNPVVDADGVRTGAARMDEVTTGFTRFTDAEKALQLDRRAKVRTARRMLIEAGGALFVILSLLVGLVVRRQFKAMITTYRKILATISHRHTALKRSETDLAEQKEWFRVTLSSIGDGVIVTDPEGRIVFMNHESERLCGWNKVEALLKPLPTVFNVINEQTRQPVENPAEKVFREKKAVGLANHTLLLSKSGLEWPIEDSAAPIYDKNENILGVVLVFHDATHFRQSQNTLKAYSSDLEKKVAERTATLQQAVSELESFSYTVSHDLRSPLRTMQGFADAVMEDYGDKLDEQGRNYLERIKNASLRLDRLISDLLSYTRISRQEVTLVPMDLDSITREIVNHYPNLQPPAAEVQIEGKLPRIMGQEALLTQVLSNLLGNAAKFVRTGTTPRIQVRCEERGRTVRLWIEDNGIGIKPQDLEKIFEMFVQLNESQLYGGTGVGLAIVKKGIEMMRGAVGVESAAGTGSKFWVEFIKATS